MRALIIAMLLLSSAAHAEVTAPKPAGIQATVIQDYNVTSAIWWYPSALGYFPAIFELRASDNKWVLVLEIDYAIQEPDLTNRVLGACGCQDINFGANIYTNNVVLAKANDALSRRYPPVVVGPPPPPVTTADSLNVSLTNFVIRSENGSVTLVPR